MTPNADRSVDRSADRFVRDGVPPFVEVYDRLREIIQRDGLVPGDRLSNEVVLGGELSVSRDLVHEALLLLEEDGHVVRDKERRWCVAPTTGRPTGFADGFHRQLGDGVTPVRRLHAAVERGSSWSRDLLRTDQPLLIWETVFAVDGVLLASALEVMTTSAVPDEVIEAPDEAHRDVQRWPTLLDAIDPERRAGMAPVVWRVTAVSQATERLSWMQLPMHGIPASLTVVLAEDDAPTYLAKNLFDLGSLHVTVDLLGSGVR
jgi:GntR family transcriptional regulator